MRAMRAVPTIVRAEPRHDSHDHGLGADAEMKQPFEPAVSNGVRHDELERAQRAHCTMSIL